jgi:hypothetical protein
MPAAIIMSITGKVMTAAAMDAEIIHAIMHRILPIDSSCQR